MKAVVLAGGPGPLLRPLTADRPAALLPVANRPVVEHLLDHLARHRVSEATLALHHCPYPVEAWPAERLGLWASRCLNARRLGCSDVEAAEPLDGRALERSAT